MVVKLARASSATIFPGMPRLRRFASPQHWPDHGKPGPRTTLDVILGDINIPDPPGHCYGTTVDMFPFEGTKAERIALALCQGCPIKLDCLRMGLDETEQSGVWGGMTAADRRLMQVAFSA